MGRPGVQKGWLPNLNGTLTVSDAKDLSNDKAIWSLAVLSKP
jgi:hypothetical protein